MGIKSKESESSWTEHGSRQRQQGLFRSERSDFVLTFTKPRKK